MLETEVNQKVTRREFLKLLGVSSAAAALTACGLRSKDLDGLNCNANSEIDSSNRVNLALRELDDFLTLSERNLNERKRGSKVKEIVVLSDSEVLGGVEKGKVDITPALASAIAPAIVEPSPVGETALLILAGVSVISTVRGSQTAVEFIELNSHSIERRGKELAGYIKTIVEVAFLDPNSQFKKKVICAIGVGVVEGCDAVIHLAAEVVSRTKPGETRVASIIFARDVNTGKYKQITALYTRDGSLEEYARRRIESVKKRGIEIAIASCENFPPPDQLLAGS